MSGAAQTKTYKGYRGEAWIFLGTAAFFLVVCAVYWFTAYERAGAVMLLLTFFLGLVPGSYLFWWGWSKGGNMQPRPEDSDDAELEDGAGIVGAFPSSSIWPFCMGISAAVVALAFVFGAWLGVLGAAGVVGSLLGYTLETRRGGYV
jgi:hypothetical protein